MSGLRLVPLHHRRPHPLPMQPIHPNGGSRMIPTTGPAWAASRADVARTIAIQAVAELGRGVTVLDQEVAQGAPRREVLASLRLMRHALRTLEDAAMRDGRPS